ncbi:MAG: IS3 family transposase [Spirochaetales bacterium]|nr:IS3 family transposase [Candidatus Physcosoma equi]
MASYTFEEKKAAVELLVKYDMRCKQVITELGYPLERHTLKAWYNEFKETGTFVNGHIERSRISNGYSDEEVQVTVNYYLEHGKNYKATMRAVGYPDNYHTLHRWIKKLCPEDLKTINHTDTQIRYSQTSVAKAVSHYSTREAKSVSKIAKECDVSRGAVYYWKTKLENNGYDCSVKPKEPLLLNEQELSDEVQKLTKQVEDLKLEVHRLQMQKDILEVAAEIVKKEDSICLENLTNREKATVIDALRKTYKVAELIEATGIVRSTYFAQRKAMKAGDKYAEMRTRLKDLFDYSYGCFGYRRLHDLLKEEGTILSEKVIRRLMKEENIHVPSYKSPKKFSSYVGEVTPPVENLLKRDFHAEKPNQKWLTDITEFHIPAGKVYLSPMLDCFDGMPVAWTIGISPSAELANMMLDKAIATLNPEEKPIVHSDRGGHYRWEGWISRMESNGLTRSMSKKGCSPDNSACEGFFGRIKNEIFYGRDWKGWTLDDFMYFLDRYLNWFCCGRIKLRFNGKSPMERRQELGLVS